MHPQHKIRVGIMVEFVLEGTFDPITLGYQAKAFVESTLVQDVPEDCLVRLYALEVDGKRLDLKDIS